MFDLTQGPRTVVAIGLAIVAIGLLWGLVPWLQLGRLPGDLRFGGDRWRIYVPLGTSIVLSIVLTLALSVVRWLASRGR